MNDVTLIGRLGADGELKDTNNGHVLKLRLATSRKYKNASGELQEATQWHSVVMFGKRAESVAPYMIKGKQISVKGEIRYSNYEQEGQRVWRTDIVASDVEFLGGGGGSGGGGGGGSKIEQPSPDETDDIPF